MAKKRVFTRKASLPCLPGDVSPGRHAAGEGAGGRVIESTPRRCCSSMVEHSDHATYAFTARRLSLPRFFCNRRSPVKSPKFGRGRTPRTKHFSFFVRSGRSPSPIVAAPRRGRTRFLPHLRIRLARDICCVAKNRVFTRKGFSSLPP